MTADDNPGGKGGGLAFLVLVLLPHRARIHTYIYNTTLHQPPHQQHQQQHKHIESCPLSSFFVCHSCCTMLAGGDAHAPSSHPATHMLSYKVLDPHWKVPRRAGA
jgi:hypothetical protein